jgi:hypothetical protein
VTTRRAGTAAGDAAELAARLARNGALGGGLIVGSLAIGVVGYHADGRSRLDRRAPERLHDPDGHGPVDELRTDGAKLFASFYALFSGVAFLTIVAVLMAPLVHRFLHRFTSSWRTRTTTANSGAALPSVRGGPVEPSA